LAFLNLITKIQGFNDATVSNNPRLKSVDWLRSMQGLELDNIRTVQYSIASEASQSVFSGTRSTSIDGTTEFDLSLSPLNSSTYRFTYATGTAPVFRTGRGLTLNGIATTFTVNANGTLNLSVASGNHFSAVQEGDNVFIPGTTTGDAANVVNAANEGLWVVLTKVDSNNLVLERPSGENFDGYGQTVTFTSNTQIRAFSASGVQIGDSVTISAGFAVSAQKTYTVSEVTDIWFEVNSTSALGEEEGVIPGAAGMVFYSENKTFVYIEADADCVVRTNGDTGDTQRLSPVDGSDLPGVYMKWGPTWSLTVVNKTSGDLNITVIYGI